MRSSLNLELFDEPAPADDGSTIIAAGGLSHFREQLRRYGDCWPYLVPEWRAWIAYFERMRTHGFAAAQALKPRDEESEPSQMCAAVTRRQTERTQARRAA